MPTKLTSEILSAAIVGFEAQKRQLNSKIAELRQLLNPASTNGAVAERTKPHRKLSAAARRKIAAAQRKRWADQKAGAGTTAKTATPMKKKRRLSAAGRKAIIEATKKRWAAVRAAAKKSARG